jgi:hypothetical protein
LVQQIDIADVACQHGASQLAGLQIEESVVQKWESMEAVLASAQIKHGDVGLEGLYAGVAPAIGHSR